MIDLRLRSKLSEEALEPMIGKILTDNEHAVRLTRAAKVRKPDGKLLCIYLPGAVRQEMDDQLEVLARIKSKTDNRGAASGAVRVKAGSTRTRSKLIYSAILGSFDAQGSQPYCRLTAFSAKEGEKWEALFPLFKAMGREFGEHVKDRFENQMRYVERSQPEWVVPGTPFTTITVNNSYPTGVHTDKGDLDEGFSCLAVARRGPFTGGKLTFPEYSVAVDLQHGDLLLMDAHDWHGNTHLICACGHEVDGPCRECGAERISVVAYYRTGIAKCGSLTEEDQKKAAIREARFNRDAAAV